MSSTLPCPHCGNAVVMRELPHQGLFASHRLCPHCGKAFTVDRDSLVVSDRLVELIESATSCTAEVVASC